MRNDERLYESKGFKVLTDVYCRGCRCRICTKLNICEKCVPRESIADPHDCHKHHCDEFSMMLGKTIVVHNDDFNKNQIGGLIKP